MSLGSQELCGSPISSEKEWAMKHNEVFKGHCFNLKPRY